MSWIDDLACELQGAVTDDGLDFDVARRLIRERLQDEMATRTGRILTAVQKVRQRTYERAVHGQLWRMGWCQASDAVTKSIMEVTERENRRLNLE